MEAMAPTTRRPTRNAILLLPMLLVSSSFVPATAIMHPVDFLALQSIRKSLHDMPGSAFFSTWDFTADPCGFPGVFCSGERVVALTLGDPRAGSPGLTGHLHAAVGRLSALAELSLVPGRVYGPLPQTLTLLNNLRFLALSRNFFSGPIPPSISGLRVLRTLDLSFNQLSGTIPGSITKIPELTNLILCHNHLSGSVPPIQSASLIRLDLKHNDLSGPITALPSSLHYLSLSWNRLTGPVDRFLWHMNRLNYLDLSINRFTGPIPGRVFSFPISTLQLQRNLFEGPVRPEGRVSIRTVDLSHNQLSGTISPLFSSVQNLYLNNNRFTGKVPGSFVQRLLEAGIRILYLQHNFLTGIEINPTAEIPLSSSLCLQYNCMVPPVQASCPLKAGEQKTRPSAQCTVRRG